MTMMMNEERRFLADTAMQVQEQDGKPTMIVGYAAVFNVMSQEMRLNPATEERFREVIRPGAFTEALAKGQDVVAKFDHGEVLGRTSNGTLRLVEDERGLRYEIDPPDTTAGRDAVTLIRRKDIPGSSFAFNVRKPGGDSWKRDGGSLVREIRTVEVLRDVSPVVNPAYIETAVALRSLDDWAFEEPGIVSYRVRNAMRLALAERG